MNETNPWVVSNDVVVHRYENILPATYEDRCPQGKDFNIDPRDPTFASIDWSQGYLSLEVAASYYPNKGKPAMTQLHTRLLRHFLKVASQKQENPTA